MTASDFFNPKKHGPERLVDVEHLKFIRSLPCLACGMNGISIEAHHLTIGRNMMGRRVGDDQTVPLATQFHSRGPLSLHAMGEAKFWNKRGIDPRPIAKFFWEHTGDFDACCDRIRQAHLEANGNRWAGTKFFDEKG